MPGFRVKGLGFRVSGFGFRDPICSVYQRRAQWQPRPKPHSNSSEQIMTTSTLSPEPNLTRNEVEHIENCIKTANISGSGAIRKAAIDVGPQRSCPCAAAMEITVLFCWVAVKELGRFSNEAGFPNIVTERTVSPSTATRFAEAVDCARRGAEAVA